MDKDLKYLNDLSWAYRCSRILQTAVQMDLFTHLDRGPSTAPHLAEAVKAVPEIFEKVLIASSALGLCKKEGELYSNTPLSQNYLVKGKPLYQGDIILHGANVWNFWHTLPQTILQEPAPEDPQAAHRNFILGMHNITVSGRGQLFLDCINLSGRRKLFDVGGGPGTYSILACEKYTDLTSTVFDLPETIAIAREIVSANNMQNRITLVEGNWETDDFGSGNDAVLMSNILHGPPSRTELKLQKAFRSLVSGGMLIIQEFLLNGEKTGPLFPALFNVMVGAWSRGELISQIEKAGFINTAVADEDPERGSAWLTAQKP